MFRKVLLLKIVSIILTIAFFMPVRVHATNRSNRDHLRAVLQGDKDLFDDFKDLSQSHRDALFNYITQKIKSQELYKKLYSKIKPELLDLRIAEDKKQMGFNYCIEIIMELQRWMQKYPDAKTLIPIIYCTGNTPWVGYMFLGELLNKWWDPGTQELLKANGIDASFRPDMKRVLAFPMDACLFQNRDAYYAFANILNNMFDSIGITKENRRFFYGDLIMKKGDMGYRKIEPEEFEELMQDVRKNGLQLEWPEEETGVARITAPKGSIQYRSLKAIESHALKLDKELRRLGGSMITTSGIGPAVMTIGDGHVGFNDRETKYAHHGPAYISPACFYVRAAHGPEDKDQIKGTFIERDGHIIPTMGVITFSLASLFYRQDSEDPDNSCSVIVIAEGTKGPSMKRGIEERYNPDIPMTYLSELNSWITILTETFCADSLTLNEYPWWFKPYREWTRHDIKEFFGKLSLLRKKPIEDLDIQKDFMEFSEGDLYHPDIELIKKYNILTLTKDRSWDELKKEISEGIKNSRCRPEEVVDKQGRFAERLGIVDKEKVKKLYVGPHLDDIPLAMMQEMKASCEAGDEVFVYIVTKGFHAVDDEYALEVLKHWKRWNTGQIKGFTKLEKEEFHREEKALLEELIKESLAKEHVQDNHDYDPWQHMSDREKELRARLLFLRFNREIMKGKLSTSEQVVAFANWLEKACEKRPYGGNRDLALMEEIQTILRIHEEQAADMNLGVRYENIILPQDTAFYLSGGARGGTAEEMDVKNFAEACRRIRPDIVLFNRENFTDHKAHSITEMMVCIVALSLKRDGTLPDLKLIGYAGVWERIPSYLADIGLMLNKNEMERFFKEVFGKIFVSQNPPPGVSFDAKDIRLFPDMVEENFSNSYEEARSLLGEEEMDANYPYQANYIIVDLDDAQVIQDIQNKLRELKTSREALAKAGDRAFNGALPMPDLTLVKEEIDTLERTGIMLADVLTLEEIADQLHNSKRPDLRIKAAKVLEWMGTEEAKNVLKARLRDDGTLKKEERSAIIRNLEDIRIHLRNL